MTRLDVVLMRSRIWLSIVAAAAYVWLASPASLFLLLYGFALAAVGEGLRVWASGYLYKNEAVAVAGPYAHLRHPLYLGSLLMGIGACAAATDWTRPARAAELWGALLGGLLLVYRSQLVVEEKTVVEKLGQPYRVYAEAVPPLLPRLRPWTPPKSFAGDPRVQWSYGQAIINGEHQTVLGLGAVAVFLAGRYVGAW